MENISNNPVDGNSGIKNNERKIRKESAAKGAFITAIISFIVLLVAGTVGYNFHKRDHNKQLTLMEEQKNDFTNQLISRDSTINEWMSTFDEIERNLALIKEKEKIIAVNSSDKEISKDKKQQVLEDIKYINALLDQNKKKIASLNAQLMKSGGTIKSLQNKISELEASIKQSEIEISDLKTSLSEKNFKIEQLNTKVTEMQTTIAEKDEKITNQSNEISNQINEMNKAFIATGTYKELKSKGLVTKEGGFIGLGRKKSLIETFADSSFKQIDITVTKTIPVNSKNAKLITEHPAGSYEFVRDNNNKVESIEIKDPDLFWKISKYAVVEIIK